MKTKIAAVLDIASNDLRLKIAERKRDMIHPIESLSYPLSLGRDTFHDGKIGFDGMEKTARAIKGFQNVMKEYGVENVRAIATTAVREASNKDYVLDQIKVKTGIELEVIDDNEEKSYVNKLILNRLPAEYNESALIVYLGSGNISISVLENSLITCMQNIKIGALRLSELFEGVLDNSFEYPNILKEYLQGFIEAIEKNIPKNIKNFVIAGTEIDLICSLCGGEKKSENETVMKRDAFVRLYKQIKHLTPAQLADKFNISVEKADVLMPAIILYSRLVKYTKAETILSPIVTLSDSILHELLLPEKWEKISSIYEQSSVYAAKATAQRFGIDLSYTDRVASFALKIFDRLNKIHALGRRERLLLHLSCILHNVGKFVNMKQHYIHSYNIIKALDLVDINHEERLIIAVIALFHSGITPSMEIAEYAELDSAQRVLVSKLCAILRLADSLNKSHDLKFTDINVSLNSDRLVITVTTNKDVELEKWAFSAKSKLFEDVYGIKAIFKKRRVI